ncbi:MAG: ribosome-associated GTPase [Parcubacteria group bacterium LiPW_41]|nr:MAG: ribosome-associated GTPase [Parcubacteria group bacterium LiPW_41]
MTLEDFGYNSFFEEQKNRLGLDAFSVARVISEHREGYKVKNTNGEYFAKVTGKQIFSAVSREDYPAVGDWVVITEIDNEHAVIQSVLPRVTIMKRKHGDKNRTGEKNDIQIIATNIDIAFVIESVDRDYNLNRFERYFAIAENSGVKPAIILNKIDIISKEELDEKMIQLRNRFSSTDIIVTSIVSNEGLDNLRNYITKGKTYCFLGSSGVGKSSLINKLIGENTIKTGDISSYSGRGKHVTTARQMYFLENGGIVIDNPGIREVGMADVGQGIDTFFDEITDLALGCKYKDCTHVHESGCEVISAVNSGKLDKEKYSNYINLKKESEFYEMNDFEKREKDRQFGKFIKRAKKDLKELEN